MGAVTDLDLRVPAGSVFALVGPNGAGKTTTIKLLMNLLEPTRGSARVLGAESRRLGARDLERIGYVSENQQIPDWMTPGELLAYCRPFYPRWDAALCARLQGDLGLTASAPLKTLSRGTRMKAALLASLAFRPDLLVLDEPFTGLDALVRDELIAILSVRDIARTVFIASHDIAEVERLAGWIGFMDGSRLLFAEPVADLLNRCRLVEVTGAGDAVPALPDQPDWLLQGQAGSTLRFVDTAHGAPDAGDSIAAAFPGAGIRIAPLSLREIFVALSRRAADARAAEAR